MILTVGNVKGGVGKTTLAVNLTVIRSHLGRDVLLIDGDEQRTAMAFTELRTDQLTTPGYTAVNLQGSAVRTQVRQLSSKYDDIIIDVGGRDTGSLRAALTVTNTILIPVQPRSFDVWALDMVADLVKEARELNDKLRAVTILNIADSQGSDNEAAVEVLKEAEEIEYLPCPIVRRKAFPNAAASGRAVTEYTPKDPKAIREIQTLSELLFV